MELIYQDKDIVVCVKPARVLSTDEPGGVPELVREALGDSKADVRTVHRLDRVVSGLMVLARSAAAASELSRQIRDGEFEKEYLAVLHGAPEYDVGRLWDLLARDKARRMTMAVTQEGKGVQPASLGYTVLRRKDGLSRVRIKLETGRTHQIRVQFASRGWLLAGDRKYGTEDGFERIALWSHRIAFTHPETGEAVEFSALPPREGAWALFEL